MLARLFSCRRVQTRLFQIAALLAPVLVVPMALSFSLHAAEPKGTTPPRAAEPAKEADALTFIRVVRDANDRPRSLETATARYVSPSQSKPFTVDLIGCIHIADKDYFESHNKRFKKYDAVLFELVMPEGGSVRKLGNRPSSNPISAIQQSLPKMLDLEYQLTHIDYTAKNFVHADLSPDQMAKAMKARGDTGTSVFFKVLFDVIQEANRQSAARSKKGGGDFSELQLFAALFDSNRPLALKKLMADQMEMMGQGSGLGQTLDTILVQDRNTAAMKVLKEQIAKGTPKIAIFYGAAHMPDFDRRLTEELKLRREPLTWDRAWDLTGK